MKWLISAMMLVPVGMGKYIIIAFLLLIGMLQMLLHLVTLFFRHHVKIKASPEPETQHLTLQAFDVEHVLDFDLGKDINVESFPTGTTSVKLTLIVSSELAAQQSKTLLADVFSKTKTLKLLYLHLLTVDHIPTELESVLSDLHHIWYLQPKTHIVQYYPSHSALNHHHNWNHTIHTVVIAFITIVTKNQDNMCDIIEKANTLPITTISCRRLLYEFQAFSPCVRSNTLFNLNLSMSQLTI
jgi:hypothetical protein